MIEEVQAFLTGDGKLFTSQLDALEYDTRQRLVKCIGEPCTVEIMSKVLGVHGILEPLVQYMAGAPSDADRG
jgi:hypothetical protein